MKIAVSGQFTPEPNVSQFATNSSRYATQKNPDEIVHRGHLYGETRYVENAGNSFRANSILCTRAYVHVSRGKVNRRCRRQDEANHKGCPYKYNDGAGQQHTAVRIASEDPAGVTSLCQTRGTVSLCGE